MSREILREALLDVVLDRAERSYDENSRTHIVYCLEVGKLGVRGTGAFVDDASAEFEKNLEETLNQASEDELRNWLGKMESKQEVAAERGGAPKKRLSVVPAAANTIKIKQVGMWTSQQLHERLKREARSINVSLNAVAQRFIDSSFDRLNKDAYSVSSAEIRKRLNESDPKAKTAERDQWVVRLPSKQVAQLNVFAREYGVSVPLLCTYLLEDGLKTQAVKRSRRAAAAKPPSGGGGGGRLFEIAAFLEEDD